MPLHNLPGRMLLLSSGMPQLKPETRNSKPETRNPKLTLPPPRPSITPSSCSHPPTQPTVWGCAARRASAASSLSLSLSISPLSHPLQPQTGNRTCLFTTFPGECCSFLPACPTLDPCARISAPCTLVKPKPQTRHPCPYILQGYLAHKKLRPLGPYSRTMPGALWWPLGGGMLLMIEVPLKVRMLSRAGRLTAQPIIHLRLFGL